LRLAAGCASLPAMSCVVRAQGYPQRPVRLIVGSAAGGGSDIAARLIGQWLSDRLGQTFVIENRPGGGTNIATEAVVRAPPDGYTLLLVPAAGAINASLYGKLSFDFTHDIVPIAGITRESLVLVVNPSVPANSVSEFIAYAKSNPGKINMASSGNGSPPHVAGELFKMMTGTDLVHVPYRGNGPALIDLIGGQVQVQFPNTPSSIEYIRANKLRALAVTTAVRSEALPNVPAMSEFLPGYEASTWFGIGAPKGTPTDIVDRLNSEINAGLADPKMQARFADTGSALLPGSPSDFARLIIEESEKWAKVVKFAGIKPE
jgi:tripartite-type tricarboxylate transporter receptor subunit TctC